MAFAPSTYVAQPTSQPSGQRKPLVAGGDAVRNARSAQLDWSRTPIRKRLQSVKRVRHLIASRHEQLANAVTFPQRNSSAETLAAEIIPLADACLFLEREAKSVLETRRLSTRSRPRWLSGVTVEVMREPLGVVLVIGAANYPLFIPGVQSLQAVVAGNAVLLKPAVGAEEAAQALQRLFLDAGCPQNLVQVLPSSVESVAPVLQASVDHVVLTGSATTGRTVATQLGASLTPSSMELSGCDAVFVLESADLQHVANCLAFGLRFNQSATCIAPRRVFVHRSQQDELANQLCEMLGSGEAKLTHAPTARAPDARAISVSGTDGPKADPRTHAAREMIQHAIADGARLIWGAAETPPWVLCDTTPQMALLQADVFQPVLSFVPYDSLDEAVRADRRCPFGLGATVFGPPDVARRFVKRVDAGCVVINDMIAPTADPRLPFSGRHQSGYGVTRGAEGLLEMTRIKSVVTQSSRWLPHLNPPQDSDAKLLGGFLQLTHGDTWRRRLDGIRNVVGAIRQQRSSMTKTGARSHSDSSVSNQGVNREGQDS